MTIIAIDPGLNGGIAWKGSDGKVNAVKMPQTIEGEGLVTAAALVTLARRIAGIEKRLSDGLGSLTVEELNVVRCLTGNLRDNGDKENAFVLVRSTTPDIAPAFVGQEWIDTTNKVVYKAVGVSASTDWKQISNS